MTLLTGMMLTNVHASDHANTSPLRVWGDFSSVYRSRDFDDGDSNASEWLNIGTINASSYIWQPWFAVVNGGLSLAVDEREASGQQDTTDEFMTGNIQFGLFPTSRFPFRLFYNQNRNELEDEFFTRDIITTEFGASQQYRSQNGKHHYRADYRRNERNESNTGSVIAESLFFNTSSQLVNQSFTTDIRIDTVDNPSQDEHATSYAITGRHSYSGKSNFAIENLVSTSQIENDLIQSRSEVETSQFSSLLSWHPVERNDISLTAGFRLSDLVTRQFQNSTTAGNSLLENENTTANINQGLTYRYSDRLQISESINVAYAESGDELQFIANENLGLTYSSDRVAMQTGDYGWSVSTNYSNQHGDVESADSLSSQFSHSLSNDFSVRDKYILNTNLTQSLGYAYQSSRHDEKNANHAFSLTWSESSNTNQSMVRFLISDTRSLDEDDSFFQLANLQYSGSFQFNRHARLSGNLTLQRTRQKNGDRENSSTVSNGQLEFTRNRLFLIPRLRFRSQLKFSRQQSDSERLISAINEGPETDASLENSLHYRIALLDLSMNFDVIKTGDNYDRLIKIQLTRSFGDL